MPPPPRPSHPHSLRSGPPVSPASRPNVAPSSSSHAPGTPVDWGWYGEPAQRQRLRGVWEVTIPPVGPHSSRATPSPVRCPHLHDLLGGLQLGQHVLVGQEVGVHALQRHAQGGRQAGEGLGALGPRQLQQAEEAHGEEAGVQEVAGLDGLGRLCQCLLDLAALCKGMTGSLRSVIMVSMAKLWQRATREMPSILPPGMHSGIPRRVQRSD